MWWTHDSSSINTNICCVQLSPHLFPVWAFRHFTRSCWTKLRPLHHFSLCSLWQSRPSSAGKPSRSRHDWWSLLSPLNCGISPVALLGRPLWQASLVSATVTPQLPNRNPICWLPASYWTTQRETPVFSLLSLIHENHANTEQLSRAVLCGNNPTPALPHRLHRPGRLSVSHTHINTHTYNTTLFSLPLKWILKSGLGHDAHIYKV